MARQRTRPAMSPRITRYALATAAVIITLAAFATAQDDPQPQTTPEVTTTSDSKASNANDISVIDFIKMLPRIVLSVVKQFFFGFMTIAALVLFLGACALAVYCVCGAANFAITEVNWRDVREVLGQRWARLKEEWAARRHQWKYAGAAARANAAAASDDAARRNAGQEEEELGLVGGTEAAHETDGDVDGVTLYDGMDDEDKGPGQEQSTK